ncbi:YbeF family protein [Bacillus atrophaeus]|uniref:YbeF family protein n=1 Tax=Bacillus atrophaeus TaxID=1452 RepID=UPI002163D032|nr:YbeF family protein [Bacillus atrophaeus]
MDELDLAFVVLPLGIIVLSIVGSYLFKKKYIMPLFSLIISLVLTFTVFNASFLGWAVIYSLASLVVSHITMAVIQRKSL